MKKIQGRYLILIPAGLILIFTIGRSDCQFYLCPCPLQLFLFCEKTSLWPERKGVARKKQSAPHFGFWVFLFQSTFRNYEARPIQEMIRASWFSAKRISFRAGKCLKFKLGLCLLAEK
jgi:hypothetical protein